MKGMLRPPAASALLALALAGCGVGQTEARETASGEPEAEVVAEVPATPDRATLTDIQETCDLPESALLDDGAALQLDGKGEENLSGLSVEEIGCALAALDTPESIVTLMSQTRALDGRQTASRDGFDYSWTYHPDSGLQVIITDTEKI